ncbi:NAD(P)/FAD-dependent oxidoreductase [Streptomyces fragilis]|uniref:FAD-dependent oxidoreductase n=1 Tax=Streptomyces fragilis TaxID=67301 RepID=A0ABV2YDJ4_9ACTN|nr:FAD-dependent oxidoreductase [Streptomyces fragilis]
MVKERTRVLVVGGGCAGMNTALRLQRRLRAELRAGAVEIVLITADPYMTYQPFLPEAAAGSISPRHVVVPLRRVLDGCRVIVGEVTGVEHSRRLARYTTAASGERAARNPSAPCGESIGYDEIVLAPGSVSRTLPVPGLADHGIGFRTVEEAIGLRNHVLEQLDIAASTRDPAVREAALTFVFVGAGYAGVEALAELEDMARYAVRHYNTIAPEDLRWLLVEASGRILPEVDEPLARYALTQLRRRNVDVRLSTRLRSCTDRVVVLDDGARLPARTLVWTTGVRPSPMLAATGLPLDSRGRLRCTEHLAVEGVPHAWAAGDAAAVPDLAADAPGTTVAPNAQHAVRQARVLADNLVRSLRGEPLERYAHAHLGAVASLGLRKGVAQLRGRRLTGRAAWLLHRAYHLGRLPTLNRKARVLAEWTLAGLFAREIVSLGSLEHPRAEFERAAGGMHPDGPHPDPNGST